MISNGDKSVTFLGIHFKMVWILNHVNVLHIQNTKYINKIEKSNPKIVWIEIIRFNFLSNWNHKNIEQVIISYNF